MCAQKLRLKIIEKIIFQSKLDDRIELIFQAWLQTGFCKKKQKKTAWYDRKWMSKTQVDI